jgi:acetyl esterase/lipase
LISASYRLVPPIGGKELLEDVTAAYQFARKLGDGVDRQVIVGGASAGKKNPSKMLSFRKFESED